MENRLKGLLSEFEKDVLDKMLKDMSYREISEALQVDRKSVDNAIQRIKRKMKKIKNA